MGRDIGELCSSPFTFKNGSNSSSFISKDSSMKDDLNVNSGFSSRYTLSDSVRSAFYEKQLLKYSLLLPILFN